MARQQTERLGERIRERRLELGLGQRDVADRMTDFPKVSDQYVSKWERAQNRPDDDHIDALAKALETTVADLWAGPVAERTSGGKTPDLMGTMNGDAPGDIPPWAQELLRLVRGLTAEIAEGREELTTVLEYVAAQATADARRGEAGSERGEEVA